MAVAIGSWAVGRAVAGPLGNPLGNPLGESFAAVRLIHAAAVAGAALVPVALQDRLDPGIALAARSLLPQRVLWWATAHAVLVIAVAPLAPSLGWVQLLVDTGLLVGLGTLALCGVGLGLATAIPLLVLLPHLLRRSGAQPAWWSVLDSSRPGLTAILTALVAGLAVTAYGRSGPRAPDHLAGGSAE